MRVVEVLTPSIHSFFCSWARAPSLQRTSNGRSRAGASAALWAQQGASSKSRRCRPPARLAPPLYFTNQSRGPSLPPSYLLSLSPKRRPADPNRSLGTTRCIPPQSGDAAEEAGAPKGWQLDPASGYYFDVDTQMYYDPRRAPTDAHLRHSEGQGTGVCGD